MEDNLAFKILVLLLFIACQSFVACQTQEQKAQAAYDKCVELHKQEKPREAIACFETFVKTNPEWGSSYFVLSMDYEDLGEFDKAIEMTKKYISLYPSNDRGYRNYCSLLTEKKDFNEAMSQCLYAISLNRKDARNWTTTGQVREKFGDFGSAEYYYKTAVELEPSNDSSLLFLGSLYESRSRLDEALEVYQKLLQLKPSYSKDIEERIKKIEQGREDEKQNKPKC